MQVKVCSLVHFSCHSYNNNHLHGVFFLFPPFNAVFIFFESGIQTGSMHRSKRYKRNRNHEVPRPQLYILPLAPLSPVAMPRSLSLYLFLFFSVNLVLLVFLTCNSHSTTSHPHRDNSLIPPWNQLCSIIINSLIL